MSTIIDIQNKKWEGLLILLVWMVTFRSNMMPHLEAHNKNFIMVM